MMKCNNGVVKGQSQVTKVYGIVSAPMVSLILIFISNVFVISSTNLTKVCNYSIFSASSNTSLIFLLSRSLPNKSEG
ncbi:hypothetical protein [Borrelia duttonii]|uniref:hypothetical protein n=1 Tax=Borrelia duttonii TaxID=40834 RepID=UPI0013052368